MSQTADRIRAIAASLLEQGGPAAVTMRAIGQQAGLSPMAVYRHFSDREALLQAVVDHEFSELASRYAHATRQGQPDVVHRLTDITIDLAMHRPRVFALMFTEPRPGARTLPGQAAESPSLSRVVAAITDLTGEAPVQAAETATALAAMIQGLCLAWTAGRLDLSETKFRDLSHRYADRMLYGQTA